MHKPGNGLSLRSSVAMRLRSLALRLTRPPRDALRSAEASLWASSTGFELSKPAARREPTSNVLSNDHRFEVALPPFSLVVATQSYMPVQLMYRTTRSLFLRSETLHRLVCRLQFGITGLFIFLLFVPVSRTHWGTSLVRPPKRLREVRAPNEEAMEPQIFVSRRWRTLTKGGDMVVAS